MTIHIMLDLETMGTKPGCAVVSIGACAFTRGTIVANQFYQNVLLEDCCKHDLHIDPGTVMWWMRQSDEARKALLHGGIGLNAALANFSLWYGEVTKGDKSLVWGNGGDFDMPILEACYKACNLSAPWKYWEKMCYRTIRNQNKHKWPEPKREGIHHNALDDALHQAQYLIYLQSNGAVEL